MLVSARVARFFLVTTYQKNGKNISDNHKLYHFAIKYTQFTQNYPKVMKYIKSCRSKAFKNTPKLAFLVCKYTIWQPWCQSGSLPLFHKKRAKDVFLEIPDQNVNNLSRQLCKTRPIFFEA
jgi:hypothetical protein